MSDSQHFENLAKDEQEAARERTINDEFAGEEVDSQAEMTEAYEDGNRPGHLGNDTSGMSLLEENVDELLAQRDEHEPDAEVREALQDLQQMDIRDRIEEADS